MQQPDLVTVVGESGTPIYAMEVEDNVSVGEVLAMICSGISDVLEDVMPSTMTLKSYPEDCELDMNSMWPTNVTCVRLCPNKFGPEGPEWPDSTGGNDNSATVIHHQSSKNVEPCTPCTVPNGSIQVIFDRAEVLIPLDTVSVDYHVLLARVTR